MVVLLGRIELPASPLPRVRSTTELQQLIRGRGRLSFRRNLVKRNGLRQAIGTMPDPKDQQSREERLAAKLRENLRRRKAQARALDSSDKAALPKGEPKS